MNQIRKVHLLPSHFVKSKFIKTGGGGGGMGGGGGVGRGWPIQCLILTVI